VGSGQCRVGAARFAGVWGVGWVGPADQPSSAADRCGEAEGKPHALCGNGIVK